MEQPRPYHWVDTLKDAEAFQGNEKRRNTLLGLRGKKERNCEMMIKSNGGSGGSSRESNKQACMPSRSGDLNNKSVGLLWNGKPNGDTLLHRISEQISQRFSLAGTMWHELPVNAGASARDAVVENLAGTTDFVLHAIAD